MSLEDTLREMMNEMKMPEKGQLDPTVHTGPEKPSLGPTVNSGPKDSEKYKRSLEAHKPKPKTLTDPHNPLKEERGEGVRSFGLYANFGRGYNGRERSTEGRMLSAGLAGMAATAGIIGGALAGIGPAEVPGRIAGDKQREVSQQTQDAHTTLQSSAARKGLMNPKGVGAAQPMGPGMTKTITAKPRRRLEETLKEHYKQRLDEKLDRSKVKGTITQRLAAAAKREGLSSEVVGLGQARTRGTRQTQRAERTRQRGEEMRATGQVRHARATAMRYSDAYHATRRLGSPVGAAWLMTNKDAAAAFDATGRGISRRERGLEAEAQTGYIAARQAASRARKVARGLAEHYKQIIR